MSDECLVAGSLWLTTPVPVKSSFAVAPMFEATCSVPLFQYFVTMFGPVGSMSDSFHAPPPYVNAGAASSIVVFTTAPDAVMSFCTMRKSRSNWPWPPFARCRLCGVPALRPVWE